MPAPLLCYGFVMLTQDGGVPWYRVVAIPDAPYGGTAQRDYASVLPAVLDAAKGRQPFVTGWLSQGHGAPLRFITNAGPLPPASTSQASTAEPTGPQACELLFPWGARGEPLLPLMGELDQLVWGPCPGRQAPPLAGENGWQDAAAARVGRRERAACQARCRACSSPR